MDTICINCPMGCSLHIEKEGDELKVIGNTCKNGETYGIEEFTSPKRNITTLIKMENGDVASCKTSASVPKDRIFDVIDEIKKVTASNDVKIGDIVIKDVLSLGVDIVITGRK